MRLVTLPFDSSMRPFFFVESVKTSSIRNAVMR